MSFPTLDIVIVDYNAGALVRECLESLAAHRPERVRLERVVVVDNASRVPTSTVLDVAGIPLEVLRNERNVGFGAACNQGAQASGADYVLFLNPDTRLEQGSLDVPVEYLEEPANGRTGIVGIQLVDEMGRVTQTCSEFPRAVHFLNRALGLDRFDPERFRSGTMSYWDHSETRAVDQVMGAFFLVRRELFERLGGFDRRFFVYFEEVDFAFRARQAGYESVFVAEARAVHVGRGTTESIKAFRLFLILRSRLEYAGKHFSLSGRAGTLAITFLLEPLARAVFSLLGRRWGDLRDIGAAYGALIRDQLEAGTRS